MRGPLIPLAKDFKTVLATSDRRQADATSKKSKNELVDWIRRS